MGTAVEGTERVIKGRPETTDRRLRETPELLPEMNFVEGDAELSWSMVSMDGSLV